MAFLYATGNEPLTFPHKTRLFKTQEQTMTCQYIFSLPNLKAEVSFECYSSVHPFVHKPSYLLVETIRPIQANLGQIILG